MSLKHGHEHGHHHEHHHHEHHGHHHQKFRLNQVATNTISGQDLRIRETKLIAAKLSFVPGEEIEIIYSPKSDTFEPYFELHDNCLVGLTNYRIFKIEKGSITQSLLQDVVSVSHQHNGLLKWDKIDCKLRNGQNETFGIYEGKTCGFFVQSIQNHLNKRPQNGHHHHHDHCSSSTTIVVPQVQPVYPSYPQQPQVQPQPFYPQQGFPQQPYYPQQPQPYYPQQPGLGAAPPAYNPNS